jgi:hypothetical protein
MRLRLRRSSGSASHIAGLPTANRVAQRGLKGHEVAIARHREHHVNVNLSHLLFQNALTLGTKVAPLLAATPYAVGDVGTSAMLMIFSAQHAERAADTLARENEDLRTLFRDAAAITSDPSLAERLRKLSLTKDQSLMLTALGAANADLKKALIPLHAEMEERTDQAANGIEGRILALLQRGADERRLALPPPMTA